MVRRALSTVTSSRRVPVIIEDRAKTRKDDRVRLQHAAASCGQGYVKLEQASELRVHAVVSAILHTSTSANLH